MEQTNKVLTVSVLGCGSRGFRTYGRLIFLMLRIIFYLMVVRSIMIIIMMLMECHCMYLVELGNLGLTLGYLIDLRLIFIE